MAGLPAVRACLVTGRPALSTLVFLWAATEEPASLWLCRRAWTGVDAHHRLRDLAQRDGGGG